MSSSGRLDIRSAVPYASIVREVDADGVHLIAACVLAISQFPSGVRIEDRRGQIRGHEIAEAPGQRARVRALISRDGQCAGAGTRARKRLGSRGDRLVDVQPGAETAKRPGEPSEKSGAAARGPARRAL